MSTVLVVVAAVVALGVAGVVAGVLSLRRGYRRQGEVVPGVASEAPASWAGAHTPEARLHRRLGDAMRALAVHDATEDPALAAARTALEEQALAVDRRLVATAALAPRHRAEAIDTAERAVGAVEDAAASLSGRLADAAAGRPTLEAVADITARVDLVARIRAELDRAYPTGAAHEAAEDLLDGEQEPGTG